MIIDSLMHVLTSFEEFKKITINSVEAFKLRTSFLRETIFLILMLLTCLISIMSFSISFIYCLNTLCNITSYFVVSVIIFFNMSSKQGLANSEINKRARRIDMCSPYRSPHLLSDKSCQKSLLLYANNTTVLRILQTSSYLRNSTFNRSQ